MSDSDEDFASADEGDVGPRTTDKEKQRKSMTSQEKDDKEESKTIEDSDAGAMDTKSGTSVTNSSQNPMAKQNRVSKGDTEDTSVKTGGKDNTRSKASVSGKKNNSADEKSRHKTQKSKGKQKDGKGKGGQREKETSSCSKPAANKSNKEEIQNTDKSSANDANKSVNTENEEKKEIDLSSEIKPEESEKVTTKEREEKDVNVEEVPMKKQDKKPTSDSLENLTFEQKVSIIKSPSSQSIARPGPDHTEKQEEVLGKLAEAAKDSKSGWGWGWGTSLLEVASSSVSTFTNQVGEGLHTMMETVESTLNVPNPEDLAQKVGKQTEEVDHAVAKKTVDVAGPAEEETNKITNELPKHTEDASQKVVSDLEKADGEPTKHNTSTVKIEDEQARGNVKQAENYNNTENQSSQDKQTSDKSGDGWFSAWGVSNITKMVETTGKSLVTGSLDVLETLGKKTFDVINEHDPGLKKARGFLHDKRDKPNLSAMLRDAKEQHEAQVQQEQECQEARKAHFGSLFDDFQGLAHLEALEMLSNQSEKRVNVLLNALPAEAIAELKPQLLQIKQNFEISDADDDVTEQDFKQCVTDLLKELNVGTTPDKLSRTYDSIKQKLTECCDSENKPAIKEVHQFAISSLAELTSKCIEQFHKAGEMILIQKSTVTSFPDCSNTLLRLTKVLTSEVGIMTTNFSDCLNKQERDNEIKVNHLVTNIYLEASNSSSYIQDGFQLLLPVLQQAAIEKNQEPED